LVYEAELITHGPPFKTTWYYQVGQGIRSYFFKARYVNVHHHWAIEVLDGQSMNIRLQNNHGFTPQPNTSELRNWCCKQLPLSKEKRTGGSGSEVSLHDNPHQTPPSQVQKRGERTLGEACLAQQAHFPNLSSYLE